MVDYRPVHLLAAHRLLRFMDGEVEAGRLSAADRDAAVACYHQPLEDGGYGADEELLKLPKGVYPPDAVFARGVRMMREKLAELRPEYGPAAEHLTRLTTRPAGGPARS